MSGLATRGGVDGTVTRRVAASTAIRARTVSTSGLVAAPYLMPRGSGLTIPRLNGIPRSHRLWHGEQTVARIAAAFLHAGIASPSDWAGDAANPIAFLNRALSRWADAHGAAEIREEFHLNLTLSTLDLYSPGDQSLGEARDLYLVLEPESAGYVVLGPTLKLLEGIHPRLPVTFVHIFTAALNRWIRVYDWRDALDRIERLREWYEMDAEGDTNTVELPDIERSVPSCMKRRPLSIRAVRLLCATIKHRTARRLVEGVLDLDSTSARVSRPILDEDTGDKLADCGDPLPALLTVFEKHDAIEGQFDEESEGMLEVTPEPNLIVRLNGNDVRSVSRAFDALAACCEGLTRASELIKHMPGNHVSAAAWSS